MVRSFDRIVNKAEAKFAAKHLEELLNTGISIAITPYKGQVAEIRSNLPKKHHENVRTWTVSKEKKPISFSSVLYWQQA